MLITHLIPSQNSINNAKGAQLKHHQAVEIVETDKRFQEIISLTLAESQVAIDLESNGFYHYPERICLFQISTLDHIFLVDTLSIKDFTQLGKLLEEGSVQKIFHSADYDVRSMGREWGFHVNNMFDTSIAASFLGSDKRGLAAVLSEYMKIVINKDKKLQRADWSQRPLKNDLLNYAADDVRYLHSLKNILYEKLNSLCRITWVLEECERLTNVKYELPNPEYKFLSVKGSGILKGQQLSVLKSVYEFRENEAILNDRPPFKIFTDSVIVALSSSKLSEIPKLKGLGKYSYGSSLTRLKKAIHTGLGTTPIKRPAKTHSQKQNLNQKELNSVKDNLKSLKEWRDNWSKILSVESGLLWPMVSLQRLAKNPNSLNIECKGDDVRKWQQNQFEKSMTTLLIKLANVEST